MRCFTAVDLVPALRQPLVRLLHGLPRARGVRWCTENQLHVTLKFLGEVRDEQIQCVCDVVAAASALSEPFVIRLGQLGCFPSPRNPRVLWCGIDDPSGGCACWVDRADRLFAELGFQRESRTFTPHVTIGRGKTREGSDVLRQVHESKAALPADEMTVESVILFESHLRPEGAQYISVVTAPLGRS